MQNLKKEEKKKKAIKDTDTKPFLFFMVLPSLFVSLPLSTYQGAFYFLFNVPWDKVVKGQRQILTDA